MTMRQRVARALRKWADLIDPRTEPSSRMMITIEADTSQLMESTQRAISQLEALKVAAGSAGVAL